MKDTKKLGIALGLRYVLHICCDVTASLKTSCVANIFNLIELLSIAMHYSDQFTNSNIF